jgi:hypothetical protein
MNLGQIVTRVQRQAGDSSGALFTRDDIVSWANEGQLIIVRKTECLTKHKQTDLTIGDGSYELPADFLFMKRVTLDDSRLIETTLDDLDTQSNSIDSTGASSPSFWYQSDNILFLFPTPASAGVGNLDIYYVRQPLELVNDNDVPEIPVWMHKEIVQYCKAQAKELDDDPQGQTQAQALFEGNIAEAQYELHSQPVDSYPAVRSLPGDMY